MPLSFPSPAQFSQFSLFLQDSDFGHTLNGSLESLVSAQLSQLGIEISTYDSARVVSFHHKSYYSTDGCIPWAASINHEI